MDAIDYLRQCVIERRVSRDDLMMVFGGRPRLSECMNKRRGLSIDHIRKLHFDLGLDASKLLVPVERERG